MSEAIDEGARKLFEEAAERFRTTERIRREAERDAVIIASKVIGKLVVVRGQRYEITRVEGAWDGAIRARGYRILDTGKRGTKVWDIGFITAFHFDEAVAGQAVVAGVE